MKVILSLIALLAVVALSAPPAFSVVDAQYEYSMERAGSTTFAKGNWSGSTPWTTYDTLTGTGDTSILLYKYKFSNVGEYYLSLAPLTGTFTTGDTLYFKAYYYNANGTFAGYAVLDTLAYADNGKGKNIMLNVNRTVSYSYVSIVASSTALSTRLAIFTGANMELKARRPVVTTKAWK